MSKSSVSSYSRVYPHFTACFDLLAVPLHVVFCQLKSLRILKPTPQNAVDFARIYSTLRKLQHEQTTALWTPLEQSESYAISLAAKRTLNLSTSLGAVSRRWLALSDINRQSVKYMELTSLHDFHGS